MNEMLDGLQALFTNNSKKEMSDADKNIVENIMSRYQAEETTTEESPVESTPKTLEEGIEDTTPEVKEEIDTKVEEKVEETVNEDATDKQHEEANEIVEKEAEQEYISKSDFTKLMSDFKADLIKSLKGETETIPDKGEPVGLVKGDPSRHRQPRNTNDVSKYMG